MAENQLNNLASWRQSPVFPSYARQTETVSLRCTRMTVFQRIMNTVSIWKTRITVTGGVRTTISFRNEGLYETLVETMSVDLIHREKGSLLDFPGWGTASHYLHRRKFEEAGSGMVLQPDEKICADKIQESQEGLRRGDII